MKLNPIKAAKKGFSLVEMLVVIAVIGIIAAIAVPNIGKINDSAKDATARRNAQNVASVYASANAAGLDLAGTATTTAAVLGNVVTGGAVVDEGPFEGTFFGVPGMTANDQTAAVAYLSFEDGVLKYTGGSYED